MDAGISVLEQSEESRQRLIDLNNSSSAKAIADLAEDFCIPGFTVTAGDSAQLVFAYPGTETAIIIDRFNEYIVEKHIDLEPFGLTYPLTTEVILSDMKSFDNFRMDEEALPENEYTRLIKLYLSDN